MGVKLRSFCGSWRAPNHKIAGSARGWAENASRHGAPRRCRGSQFSANTGSSVLREWIIEPGFDHRLGLPDLLDEFAPLFGRNPAGLERRDVDDLALVNVNGFGIRLLEPLPAHLVGIPCVIAHELEAFVWNVLVMRAMKSHGLNTSKLRWSIFFGLRLRIVL